MAGLVTCDKARADAHKLSGLSHRMGFDGIFAGIAILELRKLLVIHIVAPEVGLGPQPFG